MMNPVSKINYSKRSRRAGFSLIEVVVAVGIFAIAIVSVIGLLGPINKTVGDVRDFDDASRVVSAIQDTLKTRYTFDEVATFLPAAGSPGPTLYADRTGQRIGSVNDSVWETNSGGEPVPPAERDGQKFFRINLSRNMDLSDPAKNPDVSSGFLAFTITLRWPGFTQDGKEFTETSQQSVMVVPAAITR